MTTNVLEVSKLHKRYGNFTAVDSISFTVPKGKVVGFLGPNGAGKTTTIQILMGITLANGGSIRYFGQDFFTHRESCLQKINFTSAFNTLLGRISVWQNLKVFADLYEVRDADRRIYELLEYFEVTTIKDELYQNLSAGQKTRTNLIKSLLNDPQLLLMDEPTASLDPDIADKTLTLIEDLRNQKNISILYTSHNMNEVTRICDEVIFLDHGKIVAQDTPTNLTKRISAATLTLTFTEVTESLDVYLKKHQYSRPDKHTIVISTDEKSIPKILFDLSRTSIDILDIEITKPTLEDVFLQIARKETD